MAKIGCVIKQLEFSQSLFLRNSLSKSLKNQFSTSNFGGLKMKLEEVVKRIEGWTNPKLAESWDNVGLLVEPSSSKEVKKIILTNDLTEEVLDECLEKKTDLIFSYHPPIFVAHKRLTNSSWKERILLKCIENRVAIYSPHTSFDISCGGITDWMLQPFAEDDEQKGNEKKKR